MIIYFIILSVGTRQNVSESNSRETNVRGTKVRETKVRETKVRGTKVIETNINFEFCQTMTFCNTCLFLLFCCKIGYKKMVVNMDNFYVILLTFDLKWKNLML